MFTLGQEHMMEEASKPQPIMFTGGAIPVLNRKGEVSMEKVHVRRYVAGKRPDWANNEEQSSDEENEKFGKADLSDEEELALKIRHQRHRFEEHKNQDVDHGDDRRLRRLKQHEEKVDSNERIRRRRIHEPEVIAEEADEEVEERKRPSARFSSVSMNVEVESSSDEDLDEEEIENRRAKLRQRARSKRGEEEEELLALPTEVMKKEEENEDKDEDEFTSEEESEYSDSEDDDGPRLKPVFVRKKDRLTIQEREKEEENQRLLAEEAKKATEERRRYTIKIVEKEARAELESEAAATGSLQAALEAIDSDDGNDEAEYETWKIRELKRIKRDRDERDSVQREKEEVERLRNMTEEERRAYLRSNPKHITNQLNKGKYRFLQKYYHRGAFFMEKEDETYSRDFTAPTLEDHFDKTVLPQVMQVKNFGRSGRTKYTHLVDQDTTHFDSPWSQEGVVAKASKVHGGMKQTFDRPSGATKKRKIT